MTGAEGLLEMSRAQLDALFRESPAGAIPQGHGDGTVLVLPGTALAKPLARAARAVAWKGKTFSPVTHDLMNELGPTGIHAVRAMVSEQDSWLDGRPCVVLDYSSTSTVARWIRDEIRAVSPGLHLGIAWGAGRPFGGRRIVLRFALQFPA